MSVQINRDVPPYHVDGGVKLPESSVDETWVDPTHEIMDEVQEDMESIFPHGLDFSDPKVLLALLTPEEIAEFEELFALIKEASKDLQEINPEPTELRTVSPRQVPSADDKRPAGDTRTAEQIINDSPVARDLGYQKDIKRGKLKEQVGDWEKERDPQKRADAAYRLVRVLEYIDNMKSATGEDRGKVAGDGDIQGITKDGDARHGTEAGMLKDFAEQGYNVFKGAHRLHTTKDTHVRANGTNKDNFQWFLGEAGKKLSFVPGLSNVLKEMGESEGGLGKMLLAAIVGMEKTSSGTIDGLIRSIKSGEIDPVSLLRNVYEGAKG